MGAMSFEQALGELERIVQDLERGQLELEAAIKAYERGTRLKEHCQRKLQEAHLRVEKITLRDDGT
ncbi:MAG: exodeoxyribonuclease VII small subunit, partial [Geminicoccales bacterium]